MKTAAIFLGSGLLTAVISFAMKSILLLLVAAALIAIGGNGIKRCITKS